MTFVRSRFLLPLAGLILAATMVIFAGCSSSATGSASGNPSTQSGHASVSVKGGPTASASGGASTAPLPSNVPLPPNATLIKEYTATANGANATIWAYEVAGNGVTPSSITSFYKTAMPAKGWQLAASPTATVQGQNAEGLGYKQGNSIASIATSYTAGSSGPVTLLITVAG